MFKYFTRHRYYCPVCLSKNIDFKPLPAMYAQNAEKYGYKYFGKSEMTTLDTYSCLKCGASDRERLYALYLENNFKGDESFILYHFSPEKRLQHYIIKRFNNIQYKTFDLKANDVDIKADITNLNMISENECDFFICSHVIEHVEDDIKAIKELYRILKPGGKGILMAPISLAINKTIENLPDVKTDEDRWKYYGQNDHVRLYAKNDFINRIKASGFKLNMFDERYYGKKMYKKLGLKKTSVLYVVEK